MFDSLLEAKVLVARWRRHYNTVRPHGSLDGLLRSDAQVQGLAALLDRAWRDQREALQRKPVCWRSFGLLVDELVLMADPLALRLQ